MIARLFNSASVTETDNCWAEFSIDPAFSAELNDVCEKFEAENIKGFFKKSTQHHVSLLYGYYPRESGKLIDIVRNHFKTPLTLRAGEIKRGDVSQVILLGIEPSNELDALFNDLYENVGTKKHTLINGKYYPHITIAWSDKDTLDTVDFVKFANLLRGKEFTIDTILSLEEDIDGVNIVLDEFSATPKLNPTR